MSQEREEFFEVLFLFLNLNYNNLDGDNKNFKNYVYNNRKAIKKILIILTNFTNNRWTEALKVICG